MKPLHLYITSAYFCQNLIIKTVEESLGHGPTFSKKVNAQENSLQELSSFFLNRSKQYQNVTCESVNVPVWFQTPSVQRRVKIRSSYQHKKGRFKVASIITVAYNYCTSYSRSILLYLSQYIIH